MKDRLKFLTTEEQWLWKKHKGLFIMGVVVGALGALALSIPLILGIAYLINLF